MSATQRSGGPIPIALTIAGSDSSGGAGIQADLKTFSAFGVYGASVVTALTAQNTRGVHGVHEVPAEFVRAQMTAVFSDLNVGAVKTGMLANRDIVLSVADELRRHPSVPLVCDPVMVATSGDVLLQPGAIEAYRDRLIPLATVLTPNLPEAARLLNIAEAVGEETMVVQARALRALGCTAVLLKGGHGRGEVALDILVTPEDVIRIEAPRIDTLHTHGTGCTLAAAITASLAQGADVEESVRKAKTYVWRALQAGRTLGVGEGNGPVDHLYAIRGARPV